LRNGRVEMLLTMINLLKVFIKCCPMVPLKVSLLLGRLLSNKILTKN